MDSNLKSCWLQTYTGKKFYPLAPNPEDVDIIDIAWALSNLCRFGGHSKQFYSVGQHSMLVAHVLPPELKLAGLLHDATEAYVGDLIRPLKKQMPDYEKAEHQVWEAIVAAIPGLSIELPEEVHYADNAVLAAERDQIMHHGHIWSILPPPADVVIQPELPLAVYQAFLCQYQTIQFTAH